MAVEVGFAQEVEVGEVEVAASGAHEHFGDGGADASDTGDEHGGVGEARDGVGPEE